MASIWSKRKELQDEICKVEGTEDGTFLCAKNSEELHDGQDLAVAPNLAHDQTKPQVYSVFKVQKGI